MFFRPLYQLHERVKSDWRLLVLVSSLITVLLSILLFQWQPLGLRGDLSGLLSTMAGILTSLVVTTFSFVFVALQLASVQFSPRIVRSFFAYDQFSQFFLWSFLACVAYLIGLQYFGLADASFLHCHFGLISSFYLLLVVFPLFIHHVIDNINASSITRNITTRTLNEITTLYDSVPAISIASEEIRVLAPKSGYLDSIHYKRLASLFPGDPQVRMVVRPRIGAFVLSDSVIAEIDCPIEKQAYYNSRVAQIQDCFRIHKFRSYKQDIPFGIRQLVDIGVKAISPAINDPTTALNCLDHLGSLIKQLAISDTVSREAKLLREKNIQIRELSFDQIVDLAFDQIYSWGNSDYIVVRHIIRTITHVIPFTNTPEKLWVLIRQVEDMELQYLHSRPEDSRTAYLRSSPFTRREHRNSLRDNLDLFYRAVVAQVDLIQTNDQQLLGRKDQFRAYRAELRESRE